MKYDSFETKTRIPFRVVNSALVHFHDGTPIQALREGATGEIVVNNYQVKDAARLELYNSKEIVRLLPQDAILIAAVSLKSIPSNLKASLSKRGHIIPGGQVEIHLLHELNLQLRGTKRAILAPCQCYVPALHGVLKDDEQPTSVNHAYTLISTHFEPHRQAKGGNVFDRVFYCSDSSSNQWQPLSFLRDQKQGDFEIRLSSKA